MIPCKLISFLYDERASERQREIERERDGESEIKRVRKRA